MPPVIRPVLNVGFHFPWKEKLAFLFAAVSPALQDNMEVEVDIGDVGENFGKGQKVKLIFQRVLEHLEE